MKKTVAVLVGAAALLVLTAGSAAAQNQEIAGGFTCQKWNSDLCVNGGSKGFAIDFGQVVHKAPTTAMSVIVDFGYNRFTEEETDMSFVGGIRERFLRNSRVSPFVQGTIGVMHWKEDFFEDSGNDFLVGGGGGVQIRLTDMIDAKAQIDFWGAYDSDFKDWDPITRLYFGVVVKMGKK